MAEILRFLTAPPAIGVAVGLLRKTNLELAASHAQLLRSQKLESIGQVAAGIT